MKLWTVRSATLLPPQPDHEPPQLHDVLNELETSGWTIFAIIPESINPRVRVVAWSTAV